MAGQAWCHAAREGQVWVVSVGGPWVLAEATALDPRVRQLSPQGQREARIDLSALTELDTSGAWLLRRLSLRLEAAGLAVAYSGASPDQLGLIDRMTPRERAALARPSVSPWRALVEHIGEATIDSALEARDLVSFFGQTFTAFGRALLNPRRIRIISLLSHIEQIGLNAAPIVALLSFLIGVVLAYQGADQLRAFGAEIYAVNLLGVSVLREIGVLLTAILVAGRSGSAFTAEIGVMQVNEEVDAMRVLGLDVIDVLVLPRMMAVVIALPLLVFLSDIAGLCGGALMSMTALGMAMPQFLEQLQSAISFSTYWIGMVKAPAFAILIGLVGCYQGLKVEGGAESVGRLTTKSVVHAIFLVIIADAAFSIFFSWLQL